ncbi:purine nucleoside phosphorylase [Backusella circina FSU 941]|nr:purine nucleoside phosphorylase [Backusella circina FSU 941]
MTYSITQALHQQSIDYILKHLPEWCQRVDLGIICGSGLGELVDALDKDTIIEFMYQDIPGFVTSTVSGHTGKLVFGLLANTPTVFMVGRCHFYEGYTMQECTYPIRILSLLGIQTLVITNASGGLQPQDKVGDIIVMNDHIFIPGMAGNGPLVGPNDDLFGTRFPPMSDAYSYSLRKMLFQAALETGMAPDDIREGIYAMYTGPQFGTRAEARYLVFMGADVVGMSTAPEVVVARHSGMRVLGLSLITAKVVKERGKDAKAEVLQELGLAKRHHHAVNKMEEETPIDHEKVLEVANNRVKDIQRMLVRFVEMLALE